MQTKRLHRWNGGEDNGNGNVYDNTSEKYEKYMENWLSSCIQTQTQNITEQYSGSFSVELNKKCARFKCDFVMKLEWSKTAQPRLMECKNNFDNIKFPIDRY